METKQRSDILLLITRNLAGVADSIETARLKEWLEISKSNNQYFEQVRNIWDASDKQLDPRKINESEALKKVLDRIPRVSPGRSFWYYWQKIAAVLLIPLTIGTLLSIYLYSYKSISSGEPVYNELYATFGTRSALKLSDGTSVWLNSGSSIKYPDRFIGNSRTVFLKGEAYFEVNSNPEKPFIVETSSLKVKATGTKFNVSGYPDDDKEEVTLVSGKVRVSLSDDKKNIKSSELNMNEHFSFNRVSGTTSVINIDTYKYIAWKDGKLVFRNDPLSHVVKKLSQVFNIDIEIKSEEILNYRFRATFHDESLAEILKLLKMSSPIDYIEVKRYPLPDGSFPRKKVIIFPASQKRI
jgi:transmembrane sensor